MMKIFCRFSLLFIVLFLLSACSPEQISETEPAADIPSLTETYTPIPPTATPAFPPTNNALIPSGLLWVDPATDIVILENIAGDRLDETQIPEYWVWQTGAQPIHTIGKVTENIDNTIFYFATRQSYVTSFDGQKLNYLVFPPSDTRTERIQFIGAPGSPVMALSLFDIDSRIKFDEARQQPTAENTNESDSEPVGIESWLYVYGPGFTVFEPVYSRAEDGRVLRPLALDQNENQIKGIWYTLEMKASMMMGPFFFTGYSSLHYLDLESNQSREIIPTGEGRILALSPDTTLVAVVDFTEDGKPHIKVTSSQTGELIKSIEGLKNFEGFLNSKSGSAHFSPSNHFLAWANFAMDEAIAIERIEVASLVDDTVHTFFNAELNEKFNNQDYHTFFLAAWLDDETMLVEAKYDGGTDVFSLRFNGSEWQHLAEGPFVGLTFP